MFIYIIARLAVFFTLNSLVTLADLVKSNQDEDHLALPLIHLCNSLKIRSKSTQISPRSDEFSLDSSLERIAALLKAWQGSRSLYLTNISLEKVAKDHVEINTDIV